MNSIILAQLAKTRQQDLLKEAEYWRLISQVEGKKSDRMGMIRRIMTDVVKRRIKYPQIRNLKFLLFNDEKVR